MHYCVQSSTAVSPLCRLTTHLFGVHTKRSSIDMFDSVFLKSALTVCQTSYEVYRHSEKCSFLYV